MTDTNLLTGGDDGYDYDRADRWTPTIDELTMAIPVYSWGFTICNSQIPECRYTKRRLRLTNSVTSGNDDYKLTATSDDLGFTDYEETIKIPVEQVTMEQLRLTDGRTDGRKND